MCVLALTIAYLVVFYGFDPSPNKFDYEQLKIKFIIMACCATIPSFITLFLLVQAMCLLKNNSGEESLSKSKVSLLFAASLLCICAYISWSSTFFQVFKEGDDLTINIVMSLLLIISCAVWSGILLLILWDIGQLILKH